MTVIIREFAFDMGHMLPDHGGACYRPHGHRYRGELSVVGPLATAGSERGMVIDFAVMRDVLFDVTSVYDHRFTVCIDDPRLDMLLAVFTPDDIVVSPEPPTAENLARWIGTALERLLEGVTEVASVRLWETPSCSALWLP